MRDGRFSSAGGSFTVPHGRATPAEVDGQAALCMIDPVTYAVLEAMDSYAMVLNPQRQILAANPILLEALDNETPAYQGLRLGEVLGCVHAGEGSDGCGSSRACRRCGALLSVLASQDTGQSSEGECCISIQKNSRWEAREFTARSLPLQVAGHQLTLITLRDISARKRQESLERIFIHDLMNTLHGLRGWTELLQAAGAEATTVAGRIIDLADHLTAEVESQRRLLQAECGELVPDLRPVRPGHILDELLASVGADSANRLIRLPPPPEAAMVRTDPVILCRILGNMVVNALEAVPMGALVRVWHEDRAGRPTFIVQNPGCMPPEVADRIFQRSFSTKASRGRGLGTYGMKVLGESVLGGKVGFTSDWEDGTRFFIELPGGG